MLAQMAGDPKNANKPDAVKQKMIEGKIKKYFKENAWSIRSSSRTAICLLLSTPLRSLRIWAARSRSSSSPRFVKGEGLEKRADDFAAEVASMVK